ncbi:hypothetical protein [Nocardia veterana]|uniref:Uncharacterized protein n=1 Tax=Nocardia veterana TaxID=132249 RepID=A0A7X6RKZ7_9NOCA|nr:hypothetical protein [Nocardia veterana]NKY89887.1 hypothetical protein [Nocardia veterana]
MSTQNITTPATSAGSGSSDAAATAADAPALRTDSDKALWSALVRHPGSTATELANAAGTAASTARRILSQWAVTGAAHRDRVPDSPRTADRWSVITTNCGTERGTPVAKMDSSVPPGPAGTDAASSAESGPTGDATDDSAPDTGAADSGAATAHQEGSPRLAPGALRGQVEDFLRNHPTSEFSPHEIGKALARSSGAVHNALARLSELGTARRTSDRPKKFALANP